MPEAEKVPSCTHTTDCEMSVLRSVANIEDVVPELLALLLIPGVRALVDRYDEPKVCACDEPDERLGMRVHSHCSTFSNAAVRSFLQ